MLDLPWIAVSIGSSSCKGIFGRGWYSLKNTVLLLLLGFLGMSMVAPVAAIERENVLLLVDFSYSMHKPVSRTSKLSKMAVVRNAFHQLLATMPKETSLALRAFAFSASDVKSEACQASALWVPFDDSNRHEISRLITTTKPLGHATPIAYALSRARDDLSTVAGHRKIILLSDGLENCQQDPLPIAKELAAQGIQIDTIAVGEDTPSAQLGEIALEGGGSFHFATSTATLLKALGVKSSADRQRSSAQQKKPAPSARKGSTPSPATGLVKVISLPDKAVQKPRKSKPARTTPVLYMEVVLDASGSMAGKLEGRSKMIWAKEALNTTLESIDEQTIAMALRAYGFDQSLPKTASTSCPNTELLVPFSGPVKARIRTASRLLQPYGYTPIAESLRLAGQDLLPYRKKHPHILLISDGKETCQGDPVAVVKALRAQGIEVRVHVIGFDLDDAARKQLKAVAVAGGGQFVDVRHASDLLKHLKLVLDQVQKTARAMGPDRFANPVKGGSTIETAQTIKPGTYTLTEDLPKGVRRYFFVPTKIGEHAIIRNTIQQYRPAFKKGAPNLAAGFSAHIYTPDQQQIKGRSVLVRQFRGGNVTTGFMDVEGRGFYFAIGDNYVAVHQDAKFQVLVKAAGDLAEGQEAGKNQLQALPVEATRRYQASLGLEDRADTYYFTGQARQLVLTFVDPKFRFRVDFLTPGTGKRITRYVKLAGHATLSLPPTKNGLMIRIRDANPGLYNLFSDYTFSLMPAQ